MDFVGERPAAAGAESGVDARWMSSLGVREEDVVGGFVAGRTSRLYLGGLEAATSPSKSARLRLLKDLKKLGSTFSESEWSGLTNLLLRDDGVEEQLIAATS